jgi:hypothetical protein
LHGQARRAADRDAVDYDQHHRMRIDLRKPSQGLELPLL